MAAEGLTCLAAICTGSWWQGGAWKPHCVLCGIVELFCHEERLRGHSWLFLTSGARPLLLTEPLQEASVGAWGSLPLTWRTLTWEIPLLKVCDKTSGREPPWGDSSQELPLLSPEMEHCCLILKCPKSFKLCFYVKNSLHCFILFQFLKLNWRLGFFLEDKQLSWISGFISSCFPDILSDNLPVI